MVDMAAMVKAVRAHALENYNKDGWDYVVECWEDKDIAEEIEGCRSVAGAIAKVRKAVKVMDDYRKDVQAEAF